MLKGIEMDETIAARLERWKNDLNLVPSPDEDRAPSSALSRHISRVREAKRQARVGHRKTCAADSSDESNR
ncbi:hypothetical protein GCM10010924_40090 [Rhizobium wenxiniae]|nr:hypothetical protein GCM10010924_40090 [Rhizobium wenxiniae]